MASKNHLKIGDKKYRYDKKNNISYFLLKNIYNKKDFSKKCRIYIIEGINYPIILKGR